MTIQELMSVVNEELRSMMFPQCNSFEKVAVGIGLAGLTYKVGQVVANNADMIATAKIVDKDGNVDLPMVEYALANGIEFPLTVGPFTFTKTDFETIFKKVKERAG